MLDQQTIEPPTPETVSAYLSCDAGRLSFLLDEAARAVVEGRFAEAQSVFARFETGLNRHLRLEEELVFPVFEMRSGITTGPTSVLRAEHQEIRETAGTLRSALAGEDAEAFEEALRFLGSILPAHEAREQHVLYPATDRLLTSRERAMLVARLHRE